MGVFQILPDTPGSLPVILHKNSRPCPPAQRLNANGSASAEQIQKAAAFHIVGKHIKKGLFNAVGCRSGIYSFYSL